MMEWYSYHGECFHGYSYYGYTQNCFDSLRIYSYVQYEQTELTISPKTVIRCPFLNLSSLSPSTLGESTLGL